jgi:glycosyltransferase involved in cell wall biosynthesis
MTDAPRVSFLVTVFDKAGVIAQTLASLRAQTLTDWEAVVVDDASRDGSPDAVRAVADPRIRLIGNAENRGPAIRLNQAAAAARGRWLIPVDGDDLLPANAAAWLIATAEAHDAPLVFGRARRGAVADPIPADAPVRVVDAPLAFAARRQITHMGFLADAALWRRAGGCDEGVFIQDQSAPLRLAAAAPRLVWTDAAVYTLRPVAGSLSRDRRQQHHDRFLAATRLMAAHPDPTLARMALSAWWKLRRDRGGFAPLSLPFAAYALNRLTGLAPAGLLRRAAAEFAMLQGVRRP